LHEPGTRTLPPQKHLRLRREPDANANTDADSHVEDAEDA